MEQLIKVIEAFEQNRHHEQAKQMQAYMKNKFAFLGLSAPVRKSITKEVLRKQVINKEAIVTLWGKSEREFQYLAADAVRSQIKQWKPIDIGLVEELITTKSWWDTVDTLAAHAAGPLVQMYPELMETHVKKWRESENMWLNRSSIIFQLFYKENTNELFLYETIRMHAHSSEFFIQKAIGWALRQYAKVNLESVRAFIESTTLKPLSVREATKHFEVKK